MSVGGQEGPSAEGLASKLRLLGVWVSRAEMVSLAESTVLPGFRGEEEFHDSDLHRVTQIEPEQSVGMHSAP